jgi:hypothetical protein
MIIGISGEKVWDTFARVRYDLSHIARLSEKLCFQKVDSSCKEYQLFYKNSYNLNSFCKKRMELVKNSII